MTDVWIKFKLNNSVGKEKALDILDEGYESVMVGVSKNTSTPLIKFLDKSAKIIKNKTITVK